MVTLGQAAKLVGRSKTALTRAINSGKLSANRNDDGSYSIDVSELSRVYQLLSVTPETVTVDSKGVQRSTPVGDPRDGQLDEYVTRAAVAEAQLESMKVLLEEIKQSRDEWRSQAQQLALTGPAPERRSMWRRLVG
jgi:hypothetical protein